LLWCIILCLNYRSDVCTLCFNFCCVLYIYCFCCHYCCDMPFFVNNIVIYLYFVVMFVVLYIFCVVIIVVMCVTGLCQFYPPPTLFPFSLLSCLLPHLSPSYCTNVRRDKSACKLCHRPQQEENLMEDGQMQGTGDSLKALKLQTSRPNWMRGKLY